jgi:hypothetical protein
VSAFCLESLACDEQRVVAGSKIAESEEAAALVMRRFVHAPDTDLILAWAQPFVGHVLYHLTGERDMLGDDFEHGITG